MSSETLTPLPDRAGMVEPPPLLPGGPLDTGGAPWTLFGLFRTYRWRILITYGLFNLENLLRLAQPFVLGLAINDLLRSSYLGLGLFIAQHVTYTLTSALRRTYDMRSFTGIYTDLATQLVLDQRRRDVEVSRTAARSALSRSFVDFFERDVPNLVQALYSVVGAFVMLGLYDRMLVPFCLVLVVPAGLINLFYGRKTLSLTRRLNDELEREVAVITRCWPGEILDHYSRVARWRIKLANWEAANFGLMEVFVLGLIVAALVRFCTTAGADAGDILAVFRYLMMFVMGLDSIPLLVEQISRLRDIGRRMRETPDLGETAQGKGDPSLT